MTMLTIRGVYDGKTVRILSTEKLPPTAHEIPVAIVFLADPAEAQSRRLMLEAARRMQARRAAMPPMDMSLRFDAIPAESEESPNP